MDNWRMLAAGRIPVGWVALIDEKSFDRCRSERRRLQLMNGGAHWKHTDSLNLNALAVLRYDLAWAVGPNGTIACLKSSPVYILHEPTAGSGRRDPRSGGAGLRQRRRATVTTPTHRQRRGGTEKLPESFCGSKDTHENPDENCFAGCGCAWLLVLGRGIQGQAADSATGIEGVWAGVLGGQLHLVVTITKSSSGELGGTLNSMDQDAVLALSNVTLRGRCGAV